MDPLLLVDDDQLANRRVQLALGRFGYQVETVSTLDDGYRLANTREYSLILLDLVFDGERGTRLVQRLRAAEIKVPIVIYTGLTSFFYEDEALEAGADDYIIKTVSIAHLAERIRGHIRRAEQRNAVTPSSKRSIAFGRGVLDPGKRELEINGRVLGLTRKEADILELLSSEPHRIIATREILKKVWEVTEIASHGVVHSIIERLQTKLKTEGLVFGLIENPGGGAYKLNGEVSSLPVGTGTRYEVVPVLRGADETPVGSFCTSMFVFYSHSRLPRIRRDENSMYSILFVDSDTLSSVELQQSLQQVDLHVDLADTPESARAAIARTSYDLILVEFDLGLGQARSLYRGGTQLIAEFRTLGVIVPILVYTNLEGEAYEAVAQSSGADGYILKKTSKALLDCRLRAYINRYRALRPDHSGPSTRT